MTGDPSLKRKTNAKKTMDYPEAYRWTSEETPFEEALAVLSKEHGPAGVRVYSTCVNGPRRISTRHEGESAWVVEWEETN